MTDTTESTPTAESTVAEGAGAHGTPAGETAPDQRDSPSRQRLLRRRSGARGPGGAWGIRPRGAVGLVTALILLAAVPAVAFGVMVILRAPSRPVPGLTAAQQQAVSAAKQESVNLQTFRRSQFEKDFNNALAGLTDQFKQQLITKKAALQQALTSNKIDSIATVSSGAVVSSTATGAVVLVTVSTSRLNDAGQSSPAQFSRLQLTMKLVDGKWLVDNLSSVGLS